MIKILMLPLGKVSLQDRDWRKFFFLLKCLVMFVGALTMKTWSCFSKNFTVCCVTCFLYMARSLLHLVFVKLTARNAWVQNVPNARINLNLFSLMSLTMTFFRKVQQCINGREMKIMVGLKKWRKMEMFINFWTCLKLSLENFSTTISLTKGKVRHIIHAKS